MRLLVGALVVAGLFFAQNVLAADRTESKACGKVADACKTAGFKDEGFWFDCMRPVLLDKTVKGVTVDAADVKACRADKIEKMKKELDQLKKVS
jgi:hypothetical protein